MRQFDDLASVVAGLLATDPSLETTLPSEKQIAPECYWQCIGRSGGTYTGGTNWDAQFDDHSATRWHYKLPSAAGELCLLLVDNPGSLGQRRARLRFHSLQRFSTTCDLRIAAGRVQLDVNGAFNEYITSQRVTLEFREGYNVVTLRTNSASGDVAALMTLWDGSNSWWVPPTLSYDRDLPGSASTGGGTGGSGGGLFSTLESGSSSGE